MAKQLAEEPEHGLPWERKRQVVEPPFPQSEATVSSQGGERNPVFFQQCSQEPRGFDSPWVPTETDDPGTVRPTSRPLQNYFFQMHEKLKLLGTEEGLLSLHSDCSLKAVKPESFMDNQPGSSLQLGERRGL